VCLRFHDAAEAAELRADDFRKVGLRDSLWRATLGEHSG
jgi:hypothetical protein